MFKSLTDDPYKVLLEITQEESEFKMYQERHWDAVFLFLAYGRGPFWPKAKGLDLGVERPLTNLY